MPVDVVATTGSSISVQAPLRAPQQQLDGEVFLNRLVTQLRAQDPSSPMDTNEMIGQTTQLAAMEQLTSLAELTEEGFSLQMRVAASALIGREISWTDADGSARTGTAAAVSYEGAVPVITVGTDRIRLDAVSGVAQTTASAV